MPSVHLFFYDGTAMTYPIENIDEAKMFKSLEKQLLGLIKEFKDKKIIISFLLKQLDDWNTKYLAVSDGTVNFSDMKKAWGDKWLTVLGAWCANVHCITRLDSSLINNEFGYMKITEDSVETDEFKILKAIVETRTV